MTLRRKYIATQIAFEMWSITIGGSLNFWDERAYGDAGHPDLLDAARDLGAGPIRAFIHVTIPWLRHTLLGAGALAALSSFDDFIRSFFLGGYDPTLPVLLFGRLRSGLTPEINAVATIVVIFLIVFGVAGSRIKRRGVTAP